MIITEYNDLNEKLKGKNIRLLVRSAPYTYDTNFSDVDITIVGVMRLQGRTELRIGSEVDKFKSTFIEKNDHFYLYIGEKNVALDFAKMEREYEIKNNKVLID